jgi:hypothetical protein
MDGTIIQVGSFTQPATAVAQILQIRSGFDWIKTFNYTKYAGNGAGGTGTLVEGYWQLGMPSGGGLGILKAAGATTLSTLQIAAGNGFTMVDSSVRAPLAPVALTASATATSNAVSPVVLTGSTAGLSTGSVVRLSNVSVATSLNGIDFAINTITANTSFVLSAVFPNAIVAGTAGGTVATGAYSVIPFDPLFYPTRRFIANISQAATAQVSVTVPHNLTVGQQVRFNVDPLNSMTQINGLSGIVLTIVDALNFTVNINTTAFTAFTFPVGPNTPAYTPAQVVPFGEDTATAEANSVSLLGDATINTGYIGVILPTGATAVGGVANDVIYWQVGKSFNT